MKIRGVLALAGLMALYAALPARATVLAEWTFETSVPTTAGPHAAEGGLFGGDALGFHANPGVVYSNPVGNGSPESFSSNFWETGDYYQFSTSATGYKDITIQWEQTRSSTGPGTYDLAWSIDGSTWNVLVDDYVVDALSWSSLSHNALSVYGPELAPADLNDEASIHFRLVSQVTTATGGTNRVDNIIISGTLIPEPATLALLAVGGLALVRRRR